MADCTCVCKKSACVQEVGYAPCPRSIFKGRWLKVFVGPFRVTNSVVALFPLWSLHESNKSIFRLERRSDCSSGRPVEFAHSHSVCIGNEFYGCYLGVDQRHDMYCPT